MNSYGVMNAVRVARQSHRASDRGLIPHLFTDAALTAEDPQTFLLQRVDVTFEDDSTREVDLYVITAGKVVAGESKTSPAEFTPEHLATDTELSAALDADTHLMYPPEKSPAP
ncbi:MAG: hypothetical protein OXM88_06280 [bacterium]|nr:hypothetical protein [bacterium]